MRLQQWHYGSTEQQNHHQPTNKQAQPKSKRWQRMRRGKKRCGGEGEREKRRQEKIMSGTILNHDDAIKLLQIKNNDDGNADDDDE